MTLALAPKPSARPLTLYRAALTQPGLTEQSLVVLTTFILVHETPNAWFRTRTETVLDASNPWLVAMELGLIAFAFARVAGSIDHLLAMVRMEPAIYAFAGLTFASVFWSADPSATFRRGVLFLAVTCYASYLVMRFSLDQIIRLLAVMFALSVVVNTTFVAALPVYGRDADHQFIGVFLQKNSLGYTVALGLPTLILAGRAYPPARWIFYGAAATQLALLLGSHSKTMLVAAVVPTMLIVVYHGFRGRRTLRGAVILSLAGSALFTVAFATANIALLARWLDKDVTLTGRVPLWQNLIPIALLRPILGHGYGATFGGYFSPIHEVWIQNRWNPSHAHNALLQIWLEIGIFGVILFVIVYGRAVARAIKIVAIVPGAMGLWPLVFLTTTLLVSITESGVASEPLGWMMFMVAVLSVSLHLKYRSALGLSNDPRGLVDQP
jgi:exopolysaccharide production protein ExoQ